MVEGRQTERWNHTASLLAQIHNANPYARRAARPDDYLPSASPAAAAREMSFSEAAAFFGSR